MITISPGGLSRVGRRCSIALVAGATALLALLMATIGATTPAHAAAFGATLSAGATLTPGSYARSASFGSGALRTYYELRYQTDGNLVLYIVMPAQQDSSAVWNAKTQGSVGKTVMQSDGNLVVYGADGRARWSSGTSGLGANRLVIQTDGNMVIRTAGNVAKWASKNGICAKTTIYYGSASSAISAACREVAANTWYTWAGGHGSAPGATYGVVDPSDPVRSANDPNRKGFDCSGLTRWAYYRGFMRDMTGDLSSQGQWSSGLGGTRLTRPATSALVVGDLLYFGTSSHIHHTAIYAGAGYIIEAPQSNEHVHVGTLSSHSDFYGALRVFK